MNKGAVGVRCGALLTIIAPFLTFGQVAKLQVVDKMEVYRRTVKSNTVHKMVAITANKNNIQYKPVYAGPENFTRTILYPRHTKVYLRQPVATALTAVLAYLEPMGYGIIIWDAYRPHSISKKMWQLIQDERYVANPAKGSGHNRGIALDLTLFELNSGRQLDMGTGFDNFSDTAHHSFAGLTPLQQQNRAILKKAMEEHGFKALVTEWWHYSWAGHTFPVLDLSFRQLARLAD